MANYFFVRADSTELKAEYSFVYVRDGDVKTGRSQVPQLGSSPVRRFCTSS